MPYTLGTGLGSPGPVGLRCVPGCNLMLEYRDILSFSKQTFTNEMFVIAELLHAQIGSSIGTISYGIYSHFTK